MTKTEEIRRLYYRATPGSIRRDLARAIELLKAMESEDERERVAVYMDGLSQMRSEWALGQARQPARRPPGRGGPGRKPPSGSKP